MDDTTHTKDSKPNDSAEELVRLLGIMQSLRDPLSGCPWDLKQDFASIVPHTLEEAYELADAIENGTMEDVRDELGDVLFQVVFYAQLAKEEQQFEFADVCKGIADKLVRRHPHVFAEGESCTLSDTGLNQQWQAIKAQERAVRGLEKDESILANIPTGLAPLRKAQKIQERCAKVGFDWTELAPVVEKIHEEINEVMAELNAPALNQQSVEEEVGDLFFAVVNLSRHLKVDAETALRKANKKFENRFRKLEQHVTDQEQSLEQMSLSDMEDLWQLIKKPS